ncbi:MAG TPA: hypothetical protein VI197_09720 [Polyangiaceae bacterium]
MNTVGELSDYLRTDWSDPRTSAFGGVPTLDGERTTHPEEWWGDAEAWHPTVLDRFIQQALLQVLQPIFDPDFSKYSYGFRPKRPAHDAVAQAQGYVEGSPHCGGREGRCPSKVVHTL